MNYLKKFESFQTHDEIHEICKKYKIKNYTINEDGSIDVKSNINLSWSERRKLPLKFNKVSGWFNCSSNKLTTLEGAPQYVGGNFHCTGNKLTTLEGAPQYVGGNFDCSNNDLTTLEGAPLSVSGIFKCSNNELTTLEGVPKSVGDVFDCSFNNLTTLEGVPKSVGDVFDCSFNNLTTLEGAPQSVSGHFDCSENNLTTLEGAPQSVNGIFNCSYNKDLKSLEYLPKYIDGNQVDFKDTFVYKIFKLLDNFSLGMIRLVNDAKVIVDDKIDIEKLNDLLYDQGKPPVEKVIGYDNI